MFCSKCGNRLPEDALFCSACGNATVNNGGNGASNRMSAPAPKQLTAGQKETLGLANHNAGKKLQRSIEELKERKTSNLLLFVCFAITAAIISVLLFYNIASNGLTSDSAFTLSAALISGAVSVGLLLGCAINCAKFNEMIAKLQRELSMLEDVPSAKKLTYDSFLENDNNSQ